MKHQRIAVPKEGGDSARQTFVRRIVSAGDYIVSDNCRDVLVSYEVSAGVVLTIFDPQSGVAGMQRADLPGTLASPGLSRVRPRRFVVTAVELFIRDLYASGARKGELVACVIGCANVSDDEQQQYLGQQNYSALQSVLLGHAIPIAAQHVGGERRRSVVFHVVSGLTYLHGIGQCRVLLSSLRSIGAPAA